MITYKPASPAIASAPTTDPTTGPTMFFWLVLVGPAETNAGVEVAKAVPVAKEGVLVASTKAAGAVGLMITEFRPSYGMKFGASKTWEHCTPGSVEAL